MVGLVKGCLRKVLGNARLTFDELLTIIVEIEGTLNARPLTYEYEELEEEVLTPSHLIYGRRITSIPDEIVEDREEMSVMPPRKRQRTRTSDAVEVDPSQAQVPPAVNGGSATGPSVDASALADTICSAVRSALANHQQRETPVPKKTPSEFRLIHHLSYPEGSSVNDSIPYETSSVHYARISDAIQCDDKTTNIPLTT
ncbi:hypothetical protein QZH41_005503 [Actinostola sp. cb2023]|nr:hypothetical protein QZH41_005503 [Actinostola sp. cb2023]